MEWEPVGSSGGVGVIVILFNPEMLSGHVELSDKIIHGSRYGLEA